MQYEALALHKKQEAICLELGLQSDLAYCYWSWGLLARAQGDPAVEKEKLQAALAIFTRLNMPRGRAAVQASPGRAGPGRPPCSAGCSRARSDPRALLEAIRVPALFDEIQNVPD